MILLVWHIIHLQTFLISLAAGHAEVRANRTIQKQVSDVLEEAGSSGRTLNVSSYTARLGSNFTLFTGNLQCSWQFR